MRSLNAEPEVGTDVAIVAGRYSGSHGTLVDVIDVPTPSGASVRLAIVRRPRAGDSITFIHDVRPRVVDSVAATFGARLREPAEEMQP